MTVQANVTQGLTVHTTAGTGGFTQPTGTVLPFPQVTYPWASGSTMSIPGSFTCSHCHNSITGAPWKVVGKNWCNDCYQSFINRAPNIAALLQDRANLVKTLRRIQRFLRRRHGKDINLIEQINRVITESDIAEASVALDIMLKD